MSINPDEKKKENEKKIKIKEDAVNPDNGCVFGCNRNPFKKFIDALQIYSYFNLENKLDIDYLDNVCWKPRLKSLDILSIIKLFMDFFIGCVIIFLIVWSFFNWEIEQIKFDEWPLINNKTNLTHHYEKQDDIDALNYYSKHIQGKIPSLADLLIWMIFSGLNITLTILSTSTFSLRSLFFNISFSLYEFFTIIIKFISIDWKENWNPPNKQWYLWILEYVQLTVLPFSIFSGICNMMVRAYSLHALTINPKNLDSLVPEGYIFKVPILIFLFLIKRYIIIFIKLSDALNEILNLILALMIPYILLTLIFIPVYIYYIFIMLLFIPFILYPIQVCTKLILIVINCFKSCCGKNHKSQVDPAILIYEDKDGNIHLIIIAIEEKKKEPNRDLYFSILQRRIIYLLLYVSFVNLRYLLSGISYVSINKICFGLPNLSFSYYSPLYFMIRDYYSKIYEILIRLSTLI